MAAACEGRGSGASAAGGGRQAAGGRRAAVEAGGKQASPPTYSATLPPLAGALGGSHAAAWVNSGLCGPPGGSRRDPATCTGDRRACSKRRQAPAHGCSAWGRRALGGGSVLPLEGRTVGSSSRSLLAPDRPPGAVTFVSARRRPGAPCQHPCFSSPSPAPMGALPSEALEVLHRLSASNEGRQTLPDKLALLERRLTVPPSPVASGQAASLLLGGQNSVHSVTQQPSGAAGREGTPSISATALGGGGRSLDGLEANSEHPSKRRRVGGAGGASKPATAAGGPSPSAPPQQRPSRSPFLASAGGAAAQGPPRPGSSKKQKNTISRYFPQLSGGAGGMVGGGAGGGVAQPPPARRILAASPAPSDQQAAPPASAEVLQTLQAEAQRLR